MTSEPLEAPSHRLTRHEESCGTSRREARRWRLAAIVLATVAAGGQFAGARHDDGRTRDVEAGRFVLVDAGGKPRAALGLAPTGEVSLSFLEANQRGLVMRSSSPRVRID